MLRDFLLLVLGLDGGLALPHLGTLASDALTLNWSGCMSTLRTDALGFAIEIILAFVIVRFLHRADKQEKAEREADRKAITNSIDNLANQIQLERESRSTRPEH